jgi:hypothetical protein
MYFQLLTRTLFAADAIEYSKTGINARVLKLVTHWWI